MGRGRRLLWFAVTLLLAIAAWPESRAHAGAWTRDPLHFYLQLGASFSDANEAFDAGGTLGKIFVRTGKTNTLPNESNFQQLLTDLYFEVGLLDRLTVFGDVPYSSTRQKNPGGDITYSENAFADSLLGLRFGLLKDPFALAIETRLGFPTGKADVPLPSGTGDLRAELRIAAGKAFACLPVYADVEFGFQLRGTGRVYDGSVAAGTSLVPYAPELALHLELGGSLVKWQGVTRLLATVALDYRGSTVRSDATGLGTVVLSLVPDNSELTTVSAALMWYVYHGLGVQARFAQIVEGLRIPKITTIGGSLFVDY